MHAHAYCLTDSTLGRVPSGNANLPSGGWAGTYFRGGCVPDVNDPHTSKTKCLLEAKPGYHFTYGKKVSATVYRR